MRPNPSGFHTSLTPQAHEALIEAVSKGLRPETTANLAGVHPNNLRRWLKRGSEEAERGETTIFTQLWGEYHYVKAQKIVQWLGDIERRLSNWQATWELVRAVAREDFGVEAVEYKELLDMFNKLSDSFKRFSENPLQGAGGHGREMDSQSNSEKQG